MLILDDILLAPFKGLLWVFKEIDDAVRKEVQSEPAAITTRLGDLYMMLETGQITEEEFDATEKVLLDRLDELREAAESDALYDESEDDDEDEDSGQTSVRRFLT
jgi:hypothetical protein